MVEDYLRIEGVGTQRGGSQGREEVFEGIPPEQRTGLGAGLDYGVADGDQPIRCPPRPWDRAVY